jgi:uncharacterized protein YjbI with pentapeptide repeats
MAEEPIEATAPDAVTGDAGPFQGTDEPPSLPATATAFAAKARDLEALRDAVVDAASVGGGLWFSYLFVLLYLVIAVGSVTHRDLFLESPVKLPFLSVELPLLGFFVLGPAIFLIVHAYVLLHFFLLAGKVGYFNSELEMQIAERELRGRLRQQLPSNIFVQSLAGSRGVRTGVIGFMLRLVAQISLVIGPIALLVFFELQFLSYHDEAISWWHRIGVLADIALLWILWPPIARGEWEGLASRDLRRPKIIALAFVSLGPVLLVTVIATFPGEWLEENLPSLRFIPWKEERFEPWRLASLHELLVAGEVDLVARKPKSLWSNRIVLPGFDVIDHAKFDTEAKIAALPEIASFRTRHLEGAVLIAASLRKADFTGAQLQGADLTKSDLRGANFSCTGLTVLGSESSYAGSGFVFTGPLGCTRLQGASLGGAHLQGASLSGAQLQGAYLDSANLMGAELANTMLQGAWLHRAQLQGATLADTQFQGASLEEAGLEGAQLEGAHLEGASLNEAQLDGALLNNAQLQGASLTDLSAWRADPRNAAAESTRVSKADTKEWSAKLFEMLRKAILEQVPEGYKREHAIQLIEGTLDPTKRLEGEDEIAKTLDRLAQSSPTLEVYEERLAKIWQETGCAAEGAPYALRGLLGRLSQQDSSPFAAPSRHPAELAAAFLDEKHCPGAHGLTDTEKATLKKVRDRPSPQ